MRAVVRASEAERDHFRYMQRTTRDRVARSCAGEMEREVHEVLGPVGLDQALSRRVAGALLKVEDSVASPPSPNRSEGFWRTVLGKVARRPSSNGINGDGVEAGKLRWSDDVGLTAFLLKFGGGMEEVPESRLWISAITIGLAYFIGGLVPMVRPSPAPHVTASLTRSQGAVLFHRERADGPLVSRIAPAHRPRR